MNVEARYDALLGDLYAGTGEPARMTAFMRGLGELTNSHITSFLREDFANPAASTFMTTGAGEDEILRYSEFVGDNIWFQRTLPLLQEGAVFDGDRYVSQRELMASRYYDGFLRHIDTLHSVGICAAYEQQRGAFLTLCRSANFGAYDDDSLKLFTRLAPHVVNAFALQMQFEHLKAQASQVTRQQRGMFLLDSQWRWVGGNPIAEQMVAMGWWRGRIKSRLEPIHPLTRTAWQSLQRKLQSTAAQQVIAIHDQRGVLAAFANVHVYGSAMIGEHAPCYVMFVRPLQPPYAEVVTAKLMQLFGLTVSESTFALTLRKHGDTTHAAIAAGITEASARTRLQSIFGKTGTHRQAGLILMIEALVEATG